MENKIKIGVVALAILLIAGFLYTSGSGATVSAQGVSTIKANPDRVGVYLYIEAKDKSAQTAKEAHDKILDETTLQLLRAGVEKADIQTINFNIYPEYDWQNGKNDLKGYIARQDIIIKTDNFDLVSAVVDAGLGGGAIVSSINFELSEEKQSEYKVQALEAAGKDAKKKAEATASGLGKNLGSLVSVQGEEFNYGPFMYYAASAEGGRLDAKEAVTNLAPRDIEVSASVRVEYKLRSF